MDGDELEHHPQLVSAIVLGGRQKVAPRRPVLIVDKLNGDVLLLGAPPVHLGDRADVPLVVWRPEPRNQRASFWPVLRS